MSLDHRDHRALCQWRLSQPGEDRRADDYRATLADSPGLGAKSERVRGSCAAVPWLSLLELMGPWAMAPNDTRAWNSGLAPSARQLGASTPLSPRARMLRCAAQPARPTKCAAAVRHGSPACMSRTKHPSVLYCVNA